MISLEAARWRLAMVWFPCCAILFLVLVLQSLLGAFDSELQRLWGWALPNFLPTIALMTSVFAGDALAPARGSARVRKTFLNLAIGLSAFYLLLLFIAVLLQPVLSDADATAKMQRLEESNLFLGPVQGLVVVALGVLFFLKEDTPPP